MAQILSGTEDPVPFSKRNPYGHPSAGLLWERQFDKVLLELEWEKVPELDKQLTPQQTLR